MIKLADNLYLYNLEKFRTDVFYSRILSEFKTLSVFEGSMFYICLNEDNVTGIISKIDTNVTLSLTEEAPLEEINEFLNIVGYSKILCDNRYSSAFIGDKNCGKILKASLAEKTDCKVHELYSENLKDAFELIQDSFDLKLDFVSWFADISHKIRHGGARLFGIYEGDLLISCAFSLFETETSSVMSSVTTRKEYRKKGYGELLVKSVLSENNNKDVFVFTENKDVESWYKKLGFTEVCLWSEIENVL